MPKTCWIFAKKIKYNKESLINANLKGGSSTLKNAAAQKQLILKISHSIKKVINFCAKAVNWHSAAEFLPKSFLKNSAKSLNF